MTFIILSTIISYFSMVLHRYTLLSGLAKHGYEIDKNVFLKEFRKLAFLGNTVAYYLVPLIPVINLLVAIVEELSFLYIVSNKERLIQILTSYNIKVETITASVEQMQGIINILKTVEEEMNIKKTNRDLFNEQNFEKIDEILALLESRKDFFGDKIIDKPKSIKEDMLFHNKKMEAGLSRIFEPLTDEELQASRIHIPGRKFMFITDVKNISDLLGDNENKFLGKRPKRNV